jgi:hypothetical protein
MAKEKPTPQGILRSIERSLGNLDMAELAESMIEAFGGKQAIAKEFHEAYKTTTAGSTARQKMLEGMLRLVGQAAPKSSDEDVTLLTDEDLERTIHLILQKAGMTGEESDAQEVAAEGASAGDVRPPGGLELNPATGG